MGVKYEYAVYKCVHWKDSAEIKSKGKIREAHTTHSRIIDGTDTPTLETSKDFYECNPTKRLLDPTEAKKKKLCFSI